jgi:hypothetical protein
VVVSFGPFVSQTDGVTLQTGLVSAIDNATTGIKLSKNGGTLTVRHATVTASTYDAYGNYKVTLDTTDTNTLGTLRMQFADSTTNLVVWQDFMVVPTNIWDSYFGASLQKVDIDTIKTQTVTLSGGVTFPAATLASTTNITAGTITTATNLTTNNDKTGYTLTTAGYEAAADALLGRNIAGGSNTGRTTSQAFYVLRNKVDAQSTPGTLLVYGTDDTTLAWSSSLTSDPTASPITASDPA